MSFKSRMRAAWWAFEHAERLGWMADTMWELFDDAMDFADRIDDFTEYQANHRTRTEMEALQEWLQS